jgi:hypothetical protein
MKQLLTFLFLISSFVSFGQFAPTSAKTKFINGIGIGSKDTSQFTAADTIALTIARDSVMYYRYRGFWRPIATGGNLSAYKLISDTLFANGYTTRARLKQGLDSLAATKGTVNSVGLTMPSAFNVANSPITTSGTLAVTAAGNATQYIRGDGVLANLPTSGEGGGASVSYYLNGSVNQGTIGGVTYYEMNKTPIIGAGTDFTTSSNGYIASFLTDANDPALLVIPAGNWNFETYFEASSGGGSPTFYIELYKYDGTTFTLIASNSTSPKLINDGTTIEAYFSALAVPQTTLTLTDRLAIRIFVTTAGRTITLHTENNTLCQVITTFTTGLTALNGLTAQVQYFATGTSGTDFNISSATATHTFNLPTASATNRGALSSGDWTTFNNKIGAGDTAAMLLGYTRVQRFTDSLTNVQSRIQTKQNILTLTTTGTSGAATLVGATLNIPQYQAALTNPVTGTGTTNYLPKFTGSTTVGNSQVFDNGTRVGINTATLSSTILTVYDGTSNGDILKLETNGNKADIWFNSATTTNGAARIRSEDNSLKFITGSNERLFLNASGNLGLGVTPSAWLSTLNALQIGAAHLFGQTVGTGTVSLGNNAYLNSTPAYIYQYNGKATRYSQYDGQHEFYTAPSGTAGAAISYTQAMTLGSNGNLLVGTTTDNGARLQVSGDVTVGGSGNPTLTITGSAGAYTSLFYMNASGAGGSKIFANGGINTLYLGTNNVEHLTIASTGAATFSSTLGINGVADNIKSGTYTPTVTIESGGGSSPSANVCRWTRVGNIVTVTGNIYFEPQGSGYVTKDNIIRITYPIARTSTGICSGPISAYPIGGVTANVSGYVSGTSTSWAQLYIKTEYSGSGCEPYFTFSYEVD